MNKSVTAKSKAVTKKVAKKITKPVTKVEIKKAAPSKKTAVTKAKTEKKVAKKTEKKTVESEKLSKEDIKIAGFFSELDEVLKKYDIEFNNMSLTPGKDSKKWLTVD